MTVKANTDYVLQIKLTQANKRKDLKVHAPKFSKPKDECWFLTLGSMRTKELLALKRFTFGRRKEMFQNFVYQAPNTLGKFLISFRFSNFVTQK